MPARAAYAAAEAEVFPVEAQMTALAPRSSALLIATVMPRSLKDPVGLSPSYLRKTSHVRPRCRRSRSARMSGVFPSFRVTTGVASVTGRNSRYRWIRPCHAMRLSFVAGSIRP